jgi:serine/threonine protein kinase
VLSRKVPYHQYATATEIKSALSQGEPLEQPSATDDDTDLINDQFWSLILKCRMLEPGDRPTASEIKELLGNMQIQDDRPKTQGLPGTDILSSRSHPDIKWDRVKQLLSQIQVHNRTIAPQQSR